MRRHMRTAAPDRLGRQPPQIVVTVRHAPLRPFSMTVSANKASMGVIRIGRTLRIGLLPTVRPTVALLAEHQPPHEIVLHAVTAEAAVHVRSTT